MRATGFWGRFAIGTMATAISWALWANGVLAYADVPLLPILMCGLYFFLEIRCLPQEHEAAIKRHSNFDRISAASLLVFGFGLLISEFIPQWRSGGSGLGFGIAAFEFALPAIIFGTAILWRPQIFSLFGPDDEGCTKN